MKKRGRREEEEEEEGERDPFSGHRMGVSPDGGFLTPQRLSALAFQMSRGFGQTQTQTQTQTVRVNLLLVISRVDFE